MQLTNPTGNKNITVQDNETLHITLHDTDSGSRSFVLHVDLKGKNAHCTITGRASSTTTDQKIWKIQQTYNGQNQTGNIDLKGTAEDNAMLQFDGSAVLSSDSSAANAHITERIVLFDDAQGKCLPVLRVETDNVASAGHAASVAPIDPSKIFYLQTRGISTPDAKNMLKSGFLN